MDSAGTIIGGIIVVVGAIALAIAIPVLWILYAIIIGAGIIGGSSKPQY